MDLSEYHILMYSPRIFEIANRYAEAKTSYSSRFLASPGGSWLSLAGVGASTFWLSHLLLSPTLGGHPVYQAVGILGILLNRAVSYLSDYRFRKRVVKEVQGSYLLSRMQAETAKATQQLSLKKKVALGALRLGMELVGFIFSYLWPPVGHAAAANTPLVCAQGRARRDITLKQIEVIKRIEKQIRELKDPPQIENLLDRLYVNPDLLDQESSDSVKSV